MIDFSKPAGANRWIARRSGSSVRPAAIWSSIADILLPLEPMGLSLEFAEGEGPVIHNPVRDGAAVERLKVIDGGELQYVMDAINLTRTKLAGRVPLIGFAGAPFTLANYAIEGGSSRNYVRTKQMERRPGGVRARAAGRGELRRQRPGHRHDRYGRRRHLLRPGALARHAEAAAEDADER